jgi:hypothetical protein
MTCADSSRLNELNRLLVRDLSYYVARSTTWSSMTATRRAGSRSRSQLPDLWALVDNVG